MRAEPLLALLGPAIVTVISRILSLLNRWQLRGHTFPYIGLETQYIQLGLATKGSLGQDQRITRKHRAKNEDKQGLIDFWKLKFISVLTKLSSYLFRWEIFKWLHSGQSWRAYCYCLNHHLYCNLQYGVHFCWVKLIDNWGGAGLLCRVKTIINSVPDKDGSYTAYIGSPIYAV